MSSLKMLSAVAIAALAIAARADENEVRAAADKVKDAKLKEHLMQNIDIFGKSDLPAIYILMPNSDGSEDIKGNILTRDFSRDPFFMQNVDREEFELKVTLRELNPDEEKKKEEQEAKR
jgi:disulfide oxidoreductase YuzD